MRRVLPYAIPLALAVALACVGPQKVATRPYDPCQYVYGACVLYTPDAPRHARERIGQAFERAAQHWGTTPDVLTGWTIIVHGYWSLDIGDGIQVWGITVPSARRIDTAIRIPTCPENNLVHEWGHAASIAAGQGGRPHIPGIPDDPGFDRAAINATLHGLKGCP